MAPDEPDHGPLQLIVVGFETTEHFDGQIARELRDLRGRGLIRVVDARLLSRGADGELTETDLNADHRRARSAASGARRRTCSASTAPATSTAAAACLAPEAYARTAGFEIEDLRRLTDEIGHGRARRGAARRARLGGAGCASWCASAAGSSSPRACSRPR